MDHSSKVRHHLVLLEQVLKRHSLWQATQVDPAALDSTQPFCMDTLEPHEWLQWVLIPRLHALLDRELPLPQAFAVTPYYEMALNITRPERQDLLAALSELDGLFDSENP